MTDRQLRLATILCAGVVLAIGCQQNPESGRSAGDSDPPPATAGSGVSTGQADRDKPTIILVYADDLDWESLSHDWNAAAAVDGTAQPVKFPTLKAMADEGVVFTNFHITTPVCGPSRACLLNGQYAHRNNVRVNDPSSWISHGFSGGALEFDPVNSLGPWMKQAGYQTCFTGKYLHHNYSPRKERGETWESIRPPGWDHFQPALGARYYNYWRLDNASQFPARVEDVYRTDAESGEIIELLDDWNPQGGPQFICWLAVAPHIDVDQQGMSAERHADWYADSQPPDLERQLTTPRPDSLPAELQVLPENGAGYRDRVIQSWRKRLRATRALDDGLAAIREQLKKQGRLDNTIFVFSSDHGFRMGQHGHLGKRLPYDRVTRVPTFVCGAGIAPGRCQEVVANIDIAPTLVELAGGQVPVCPDQIDGRSIAALLQNPEAALDPPRAGVLLEHWETEINDDRIFIPAAWSAWRTRDHIYTEWATGGREYYDLSADPDQMHNLYADLNPARQRELADQLRNSRHRAGEPLVSDMLTRHDINLAAPISANFNPLPLTGYVEAGRGVREARLEFYCPATGEFWDGSAWTDTPSRLAVELDNPGGQISRWSFAVDNSPNLTEVVEVPEREVQVSLTVTDTGGSETKRVFATPLTMRFDDPESWIDTPDDLSGGCRPLRVTGRAMDNTAVTRVTLVINDKETGEFWDGEQWVTDYIALDAELEPGDSPREVTWSLELTAHSDNRVFVGSRAIDDHHNYDRTLPFFEFPPVEPERE